MKILGIDPGTRIIGYGLINKRGSAITACDYGVIRLSGKLALTERLKKIHHELGRLLKRLKPETIIVEDIFYAKDVRAMLKLGEARGVILLAASQLNVPIYEYTPAEIKKSVTGNGRADKSQVQKMVTLILGLRTDPKPYDASDALAIALCHAHHF